MTVSRSIVLAVATFVAGAVMWGAPAQAQGQGASPEEIRANCEEKADQTLASLDRWLEEYNRQMDAAEPLQKPKYEEWVRELEKLKTLVEQAKAKLEDSAQCQSEECLTDQCSLVDIADQQVAQLVKETEQQLGGSVRFGEEMGRSVLLDAETLGDDTLLGGYDPAGALDPSQADQSDDSDEQTGGNIGTVFPGPDPDSSLPPDSPKDEASSE
ncbi:MAG: hypothetical protein C4523_21320 [Myxococcales bacterium]|nr:MAG: hypothetical protein C4523_21320 [Myxococcales bacterium]